MAIVRENVNVQNRLLDTYIFTLPSAFNNFPGKGLLFMRILTTISTVYLTHPMKYQHPKNVNKMERL